MSSEVMFRLIGAAAIVSAVALWGVGLTGRYPHLNWTRASKVLAVYGLLTLVWGGSDAVGYARLGGLLYVVGGLVTLNRGISVKNRLFISTGLVTMLGGFLFMILSVVIAAKR